MKLWLYEGGVRVPGIFRWPGRIRAGQVVGEPVCGLDVLPTLCELAGVDVPTDRAIDGSSITALLEGKPLRRQRPLYWHYFNAIGPPKAAMRVGDWVVLGRWDQPQSTAGGGFQPGRMAAIKNGKLVGFELYNLRTDPAQQQDLATAEPERLRELSEELRQRYAEVQAEGPVWSQ
jgi:arylsulfatase A